MAHTIAEPVAETGRRDGMNLDIPGRASSGNCMNSPIAGESTTVPSDLADRLDLDLYSQAV